MSTLEDQKVTIIPPKLAKRRRRLPASPPRSGTDQQQPPKKLSVEAELSRLPPEVMKELRSFDNNDKFMPGKVEDLTETELTKSGSKKSILTLKSGKKLEISLVEGSFRRITGLREQMDDSGSFILRRVEIKREPGKSLGFYIREGDGWSRPDGIFVSRVNLGSSVDINGLLRVGDEIARVNNVDVTQIPLDDVVLVMQYVKRMILNVKVLTSFSFTNNLSFHKSLVGRKLPRTPSSFDVPSPLGDKQGDSEEEDPYSKVESIPQDNSVEVKRLRFRRKHDTLTDSMTKSTNFGESFIKKLNSPLVKVKDSHRVRDEAEINPYKEVSFNSEHKEQELPSISESPKISPYARVTVRTDANTSQLVVEVHPHEEVSSNKSQGGVKPSINRVEMGDGNTDTIHPYESVAYGNGRDGGKRDAKASIDPYEEIERESKKAEELDLENTGFNSQMKMDSLLELLRNKPIVSSSPAVKRKSDIVDDVVVNPDHIYAKIDRTRKYSPSGSTSTDEEAEFKRERERALSNTTPPPLPTSPLPHDISIDAISDMLSRPLLIDESQELQGENKNIAEGKSSSSPPTLRHNQLTADDLEVIDSSKCDDSKYDPDVVSAEGGRSPVTDDILDQLGKEGPAPPLPPPYIPDEGPPDSSDDESEGYNLELGTDMNTPTKDGREEPIVVTEMPVIKMEEEPPTHSELKECATATPTETKQAIKKDISSEMPLLTHGGVEDNKHPLSLEREEQVKELEDTSNLSTCEQDTLNADTLGSLEEGEVVPNHELSDAPLSSDVIPDITMSQRDSYSDLPPPPPPPSAPPDDDDDDVEQEIEREDEREDKNLLTEKEVAGSFSLLLSTNREEGEDPPQGNQTFSGVMVLMVHGLDTSNETSQTFWSGYDVQKVALTMAVDGKVKVIASIPMKDGDNSVDDGNEYRILLLKNSQATFSINPVCLPTISKTALIGNMFISGVETTRNVYVDFEHYGHLKVSLEYRQMSSIIHRLDLDGYSKASFTDLVSLNPRNSGCPLIVEQCIEIIEQYGSKTPHLYERCTVTSHKHKALAACMSNLNSQSIKNIVVACSVHAFTGLIVDFFCDLPEPFFTNDISSSLTQSASVDEKVSVLESFMQCLPEDVGTTLQLLLRHFKRLFRHSERNGVTVKSIARLFGPLLLIPSLSADLNTSTTALEYAEEHESQAKVIELLLSRKRHLK